MDKLVFRTIFSERYEKKGITFSEPSRTKQQFKEQSDINNILKRYQATGILDHVSKFQPVYADVADYGDLTHAFEIVNNASEAFNALPSELRFELDNDPRKLVEFIKDPNNAERCIKYGLFDKPTMEVVENRLVDSVNSTDVVGS